MAATPLPRPAALHTRAAATISGGASAHRSASALHQPRRG